MTSTHKAGQLNSMTSDEAGQLNLRRIAVFLADASGTMLHISSRVASVNAHSMKQVLGIKVAHPPTSSPTGLKTMACNPLSSQVLSTPTCHGSSGCVVSTPCHRPIGTVKLSWSTRASSRTSSPPWKIARRLLSGSRRAMRWRWCPTPTPNNFDTQNFDEMYVR